MLIRLTAVAALLATAAAVSWSHPQSCAPPTGAAAVSRAPTRPAAAPQSSVSENDTATVAPTIDQAGSPVMPSGSVGVPVRLADPTALALVRPGNHVDLLRLNGEGGDTTAVATAALVLDVTGANDPTTGGGLLLALTPAEARQAVATPQHGFAIVIRPG